MKRAKVLPVLPLRDVVLFPHVVMPLFVGRARSVAAIEYAEQETELLLALTTQKNPYQEDAEADDLYHVGVVAKVLQILKMPDGTIKLLVEGICRAKFSAFEHAYDTLMAKATPLKTPAIDNEKECEALRRTVVAQFEQYVKTSKKVSPEIANSLVMMDDYSKFADHLCSHLPLRIEQKQKMLEILPVLERLESVRHAIESEMDIVQVEKRIRGRVKRQMEKNQREYYLNEQVKAIQKELGEEDDTQELEQLEKRIMEAGMSEEAQTKALAELKKLKAMPGSSSESAVIRNYIDVLLGLPWQKKTEVLESIAHAKEVLDEEHYGLEKVKERIVEYLAVQKRVDRMKAPILCLVGPPGVGKTSLGESIARATNRSFVRMALGGVRDEAEIRGHRRTYIGALPGKILHNLSKAGVNNPLFLLDEIDKIGMDFRGDPASALLEVLDPEQNIHFIDHYAEVEFDLSNVMFVATANSLNIPPALLDRLEVIRLSGYTEDEKLSIADQYLLKKQKEANGVQESELDVSQEAVRDMVRYYTREAGVRHLSREIAKICRKVVTAHSSDGATKTKRKKKQSHVSVDSSNLKDYLGIRKFDFGLAESKNRVGLVSGLAWTEVGGDLLSIEAVVMPGKGNILRTGKLGEVMQESVQAAMSVVRTRSLSLGLPLDFYEKHDVHIHFPEGATPKDGPSAGIGIVSAVVSAFTQIPVRADVAMTGEITLRGEVLEIGGLKEKLLAAHRGGIRHVLIPHSNIKDLEEIPANVKEHLEIHPVKWIEEVLMLALERQPEMMPQSHPLPEGANSTIVVIPTGKAEGTGGGVRAPH